VCVQALRRSTAAQLLDVRRHFAARPHLGCACRSGCTCCGSSITSLSSSMLARGPAGRLLLRAACLCRTFTPSAAGCTACR
jgi:hypothetical protein